MKKVANFFGQHKFHRTHRIHDKGAPAEKIDRYSVSADTIFQKTSRNCTLCFFFIWYHAQLMINEKGGKLFRAASIAAWYSTVWDTVWLDKKVGRLSVRRGTPAPRHSFYSLRPRSAQWAAHESHAFPDYLVKFRQSKYSKFPIISKLPQ